MRLGLTLPAHGGVHSDGKAPLALTHELAAAAELAGFATLYFHESHFDERAGFANPFAMAAAASGQITHAWLGVRALVRLHHPLRLVEQSNLLDVLTRGRCLIVLADDAESDGRLEEQVESVASAWAWEYEEDGPPMQVGTELYSGRMAGRIMPAPFRASHPLVARECASEAGVLDAARRGWLVQLGADVERTVELARLYAATVRESGHAEATVQECLERLTAIIDVQSGDSPDEIARQLDAFGPDIREVRLDLAPGVPFERAVELVRRQAAPSLT